MSGVGSTSLISKVNAIHVVVVVIHNRGYEQSLGLTAAKDSAYRGCVRTGASWLAAFAKGCLILHMHRSQKADDIVVLPSDPKHVRVGQGCGMLQDESIQGVPCDLGIALELIWIPG